ncbi:MAG: glutamyl-tRNA reductase [Magnetococcales bacterium]|nr:glutamyl-tRNA reductase [Magnetococcales bacterium]
MNIVVVGLNHKSTPIAIRERLSYSAEDIPSALAALTGLESIAEAVILSTCNRVEIYVASRDRDHAIGAIATWMAQSRDIALAELEPHLYHYKEEAAVAHGFRVASSLDSMVVGEPQILGQMKEAYHFANSAKTTGLLLNKYFHRAFRVAKRVRTETAIAENVVSVSTAAVNLAKKIFGDLSNHSCLLIGAGEMCELAAQHLIGQGISKVLVTNRTLSRARQLADRFHGEAFALETLEKNLHRADIIISSTGSPRPILSAAMVRNALKQRRQQPMFLIDIAVPRDIDPAINSVDSAFLYDIDDLNKIVQDNMVGRHQAAENAQNIVDEEVPEFIHWLQSLDVVPTIVDLRNRLESLKDRELERTFQKWPGLSDDDRKRVEELGRLLINKVLHDPVSRLRTMAGDGNGDVYVDATRKLFGLDSQH